MKCSVVKFKGLLAVTGALLFNWNAMAATRFVKPAATGLGNGTSWANASADLQGMINNSNPGDQVWVAKGTYKPTQTAIDTGTRDKTFLLKAQVKVYGGFNGVEATVAERNPGADPESQNPTILSGDLNGDDTSSFGNRSDNVYHVVLAMDGYCPCEDCVFGRAAI